MKPRCKSFVTKLEAEKWARDLEAQVDRCGTAPDTKILESAALGQLLERYQREVSPLKRGAVQEIQRIDVLRRHDLAYRTMVGLSQQDIASFRDERLQSVAPSSAVRELAILSHVLKVAIRDWGLPLPDPSLYSAASVLQIFRLSHSCGLSVLMSNWSRVRV